MAKGPGFDIKNCTQIPITVALSQVGPLYYGLVQPNEIFTRKTGAVWFTINAVASADNKCHIDDWDCAIPIIVAVSASLMAAGGVYLAATGAAAAAKVGAVLYGFGMDTAIGAVAANIVKYGDAEKRGCYAGPEWPFRKDRKNYSVVGGPVVTERTGTLPNGETFTFPYPDAQRSSPLRIVEGHQPDFK